MSWLGFANHFLSNQRLHVWSWINRIFSWEWCFLVGNSVLSVLGLFLFCFCLVWGEQVTDAQDFGWQSKGEDHFRSWFPFLSCLLRWQFCIVQILSGPKTFLPISFIFFRSLIGNFPSFAFFWFIDWEFSPFLFFSFSFFFCFLPRARMDILTLGQGLW